MFNLPQEYSELTTKLHDLEKKEQDLREQIAVGASAASAINGGGKVGEVNPSPSPGGPTTSLVSPYNRNNDENFIAQSLQSGDEGLSPRSPFKSVIRAYLPNQQRTSVQVNKLLIVYIDT